MKLHLDPTQRRILYVAATLAGVALLFYIWISVTARDEAGQAQQQLVVDSVVKHLQDSAKASDEMRQLLINEQERTDSATEEENRLAAEATADRKTDFLWRVYNSAAAASSDAGMRKVFERNGTAEFQRYLTQRAPNLPELLFFPTQDLKNTSIWHFQNDWFAVSTPQLGIIVLRVVTDKDGRTFRIDNVQQASKPIEPEEEEEEVIEEDDYSY